MPLSLGDYGVTFTVYDGEGHDASITYYLDGATSISDMQTWSNAFRAVLENIVDGDVRFASISRVLNVWTAGSATDESDVEIRGKFTWLAQNTLKKVINSIPTFRRQYIVAKSKDIDTTEVNVAAYIDAMTTGIDVGGTPIRPRDSENRQIDALFTAKEDYGKTRR